MIQLVISQGCPAFRLGWLHVFYQHFEAGGFIKANCFDPWGDLQARRYRKCSCPDQFELGDTHRMWGDAMDKPKSINEMWIRMNDHRRHGILKFVNVWGQLLMKNQDYNEQDGMRPTAALMDKVGEYLMILQANTQVVRRSGCSREYTVC